MGKALAAVDKQLAAEAAAIADTISAPSSNKIKTRDKVFKLPDGLVLPGPISVIIIDYISRNTYYEGAYNENDPQDPSCWAINKRPADLAPGSDVKKPYSKTCDTCAYDEFGSSSTGGGKACKNSRILAILLATLDDDKMYTIEASPTAIKAFDAYVGVVAKLFTSTPVKVITELSFHPEKTYPSLMFGNPQPNPDYVTHYSRRQEAIDLLNIAPISGIPPTTKKKTTRRKRK